MATSKFLNRLFFLKVLFWGGLFIFVLVALNVWLGRDFWIDRTGFLLAKSLQSPAATHFFLLITFIGSSTFLLPANILLALAAIRKLPGEALRIALTALSSLLFMYLFKSMFRRDRPEEFLVEAASGFSFPSGHTLNSTVFFGLLLYFLIKSGVSGLSRRLCFVIFGLLVFLIGFSRVYLHVHYTSDVIAGFFLGCAWLILALSFKQKGKAISAQDS